MLDEVSLTVCTECFAACDNAKTEFAATAGPPTTPAHVYVARTPDTGEGRYS